MRIWTTIEACDTCNNCITIYQRYLHNKKEELKRSVKGTKQLHLRRHDYINSCSHNYSDWLNNSIRGYRNHSLLARIDIIG